MPAEDVRHPEKQPKSSKGDEKKYKKQRKKQYPCLIPGSGRSAGEGLGYSLQYSWASLVAQLVKKTKNKKIHLQCGRPGLGVGKIPWKRKRLPSPEFWPGECHGLYND